MGASLLYMSMHGSEINEYKQCELLLQWMSFSRPKLKEHMKYCDLHPEEIDKLAKVKAQVSEVKGVMMQNIEKVHVYSPFILIVIPVGYRGISEASACLLFSLQPVTQPLVHQVLDRGEKIELLVDKTEDLRSQVSYSHTHRDSIFSFLCHHPQCMRHGDVDPLIFACRHKISRSKEQRYGRRCGGRT